MMREATKYISFLLCFILGFGCFAGASYVALNTVTINQLRANNININTDEFLGDNPQVPLEDMTVMGALDEFKKLAEMGDDLNIDTLVERYDLILPETVDKLLTPEARQIPISKLLSMEGVDIIVSHLHLGDIEKYERRNLAGEPCDFEEPDSYWYNLTTEERVVGLDAIVADFSLYDILHGQITADNLLSELTIAQLLGYELREDGKYYQNGEKVTGILAIFANCTVFNISEQIEITEIGHLIGYEYDEAKEHWVDEFGVEVHGFMNVVASRHINDLGGVMDDITIGDIIPADQRTGIMSIIPADTGFNNINDAVFNAVKDTPLQFFMNTGLVTFEETTKLDGLSNMVTGGITVIKVKTEGEEGYEEFLKACNYYGEVEGEGGHAAVWTAVKDSHGNVIEYKVPTWRTKPLSQSFDYILSLIPGLS